MKPTILFLLLSFLFVSCSKDESDNEIDKLNQNLAGNWWPELSDSDFEDLSNDRDYLLLPTFFIENDRAGEIVTYKHYISGNKEYSSTQPFLKVIIEGYRLKFYYMEHMQSWIQYTFTPISEKEMIITSGNYINKPHKYIKR